MEDRSRLRPPVALLTEAEAAELLQLHPVTLARLRRRGEIAYVSAGRRARYLPSQLAEYVERQVVPVKAMAPTSDPPSPPEKPAPGVRKPSLKGRQGRDEASTEAQPVKPVDRLAADTFALFDRKK